MDDLLVQGTADRRFSLILFEAFALTALLLAAAGIHGAMAGRVTERAREIGVRAALGASGRQILVLVLGEGAAHQARAGRRFPGCARRRACPAALLFGISHLDPATDLATIMILAGVAALACAVSAWRALRVAPAIALRAE